MLSFALKHAADSFASLEKRCLCQVRGCAAGEEVQSDKIKTAVEQREGTCLEDDESCEAIPAKDPGVQPQGVCPGAGVPPEEETCDGGAGECKIENVEAESGA